MRYIIKMQKNIIIGDNIENEKIREKLVFEDKKNVYKHISINNNKTISNIKTSIIKSTNYVYDYQNEKILYQYFSMNIKITPKLVISTILKKLIYNNI